MAESGLLRACYEPALNTTFGRHRAVVLARDAEGVHRLGAYRGVTHMGARTSSSRP